METTMSLLTSVGHKDGEMASTTDEGTIVYHRKDAGATELHTGGDWFFQPADYDGGDVFSKGYATRAEAMRAAEAWEDQRIVES